MASQQDIDEQQVLLATHRRTLATLLAQQATFTSAYAPPQLVAGIAEARAEIQRIKAILADWGVVVDDYPDDQAPQVAASVTIAVLSRRQQPGVPIVWLGVVSAILALVIGLLIWQAGRLPPSTIQPTAALVAPPTAALVAAPATAAPQVTPTLPQPCYDEAVGIAGTVPGQGIVYTEAFTTSTLCVDINARFSELPSRTYVTAVKCNDLTPFTSEKPLERRDTWYIIATNVRDATCFKLGLRGDTGAPYPYKGLVAH